MRILVVSDTHGDYLNLNRLILSQPKAEVVIHLGDGESEIDKIKINYKNKMFICVKGNCDWGSCKPEKELITIENKKIIASHGHLYNVKSTLYNYECAARESGAEIALFGHTHVPYNNYCDGLYMMNPGSLRGTYGTYGWIDIDNGSIVTNIVKLNNN